MHSYQLRTAKCTDKAYFIRHLLQMADFLVENFHQDCAHDGRDDDAHHAWAHKAVVQ